MPLSTAPAITLLSCLMGTIGFVFGIINIFYPETGLTFFEIPTPTSSEGTLILETLMIVLGIRDIFLAVAIYVTALYGSRRAMAWILIAAGGCAAVDGVACRVKVGAGEWNHWNYAPVLVGLGLVKLGVLG